LLSPNTQFYERIWYVEYYSVHAHMQGRRQDVAAGGTKITRGAHF